MDLWTEGLERANCSEVVENEDEVTDTEIMYNYVPQGKPSGSPPGTSWNLTSIKATGR